MPLTAGNAPKTHVGRRPGEGRRPFRRFRPTEGLGCTAGGSVSSAPTDSPGRPHSHPAAFTVAHLPRRATPPPSPAIHPTHPPSGHPPGLISTLLCIPFIQQHPAYPLLLTQANDVWVSAKVSGTEIEFGLFEVPALTDTFSACALLIDWSTYLLNVLTPRPSNLTPPAVGSRRNDA
jgi:hypothetical protein